LSPVAAELPADGAQTLAESSPTAMGLPLTHEHGGAVCARAGGLGGPEDGSLPPHLRAGSYFNRRILSLLVNNAFGVN